MILSFTAYDNQVTSSHNELIWGTTNSNSMVSPSSLEPSQFINYEPVSALELYATSQQNEIPINVSHNAQSDHQANMNDEEDYEDVMSYDIDP